MASIVSAGTTSATALNMSADTSGVLQLASNNGTVALTINTSQLVGVGTGTAALDSYNPLQLQAMMGFATSTGYYSEVNNNLYYGSGSWRNKNQGPSSQIVLDGGASLASSIRFNVTSNATSTAANTALTLTEAMKITSSAQVCIGTSSSLGARLALYGTSGGSDSNIQITNPGYGTGCIGVNGTSSNFKLYNCYASGTIGTGAGIDIDTSGNVLIGTTTAISGTRMAIERIGGGGNECNISFTSSGTQKWKIGNNATDSFVVYNASNTGVYLNQGSTSWISTSDARLKTVNGNIENALAAVASLSAVKFTWKSDEENKPQVGLLAQEVQEVLPEAVGEDVEGFLGVRYTEVVPLLVAAIKELNAKVTALENK